MPLKKIRSFVSCFILTVLFLLACFSISYALTLINHPPDGKIVWYNPINGKSVTLPDEWNYVTVVPGLRWKIYWQFKYKRKQFEFILDRRGTAFRIGQPFHEFELRDSYRKDSLCKQSSMGYSAGGEKGEIYEIKKFYPDFIFDEKAGALIIGFVSKKDSLDYFEKQKIFCPFIESFFTKDSRFHLPESNEWHNPLSEKSFILLPDIRVKVKDIVSFERGSYQAYTLTDDNFRIDLIKIRDNPYFADHMNIRKMDFPEDTVFDWKKTDYVLSDFDTSGFTRREARFEGTQANGKKIRGLAFDYQKYRERILLKVWNLKGGDVDDRIQDWARKLLDNSISD